MSARIRKSVQIVAAAGFLLAAVAGPQARSQPPPPLAAGGRITTFRPKAFGRSAPLRDMRGLNLPPIMRRAEGTAHYNKAQLARLREVLVQEGYLKPPNQLYEVPIYRKKPALSPGPVVHDPVRQGSIPRRTLAPFAMSAVATPAVSFDGLGDSTGFSVQVVPPDTDMAAGINDVVEIVNGINGGVFQVYDKTGNPIGSPVLLENLWASVGGNCENGGYGDNVVVFDQLAERYVITQLGGFTSLDGGFPTDECMAVSQTSDPTGAYYVYDFPIFRDVVADYPKIAVWPDAYYASVNFFDTIGLFIASGFIAFDRSAVLQGDPSARMIVFESDGEDLAYSAYPADLDGSTPPPAGAPELFVDYVSPSLWGSGAPYALEMWQMHVDWASPFDSRLTGPTEIDVAPFNDEICGTQAGCIPQPSPGETLDSMSDRLMFRLAYRNGVGTDGHQALVVNQTVGVSGASPPAGVRWYELDAPAGSTDPAQWTLAQQGTFAPNDGASRWMGSIAMDRSGDIALGYSVSSASLDPSIAYTGRLAGDPAGMMTEAETTLASGGGVQEGGGNRWGDYSSMMLDPTDDCTFWYAQEYYAATGYYTWSTHIGAFDFPSCTPTSLGTLSGTVTDAATGNPIASAIVSVGSNGIVAFTDASGQYQVSAPAGGYTATASDAGYEPQSAPETVSAGGSVTQDFALQPGPIATVSGTVTDAGHGYGLSAEVKVSTEVAGQVAAVWTDPATGNYSVRLPVGPSYTLDVSAHARGFNPARGTIADLSGDTTRNFALSAKASCAAPGYANTFGEDFDEGFPPAGWTVTNAVAGSPVVWNLNSAWNQFNYTGGSGVAATADPMDAYVALKYQGAYDTSLVSAPIAVSSLPPSPTVQFLLNARTDSDAVDVDVSGDGGATWQNLAHIMGLHGQVLGPRSELYRVPLTVPGGATSIQLRWRYYGASTSVLIDGYAQIDDVAIGACLPVAGGLVVGQVTAQDSGAGQGGAKVADTNAPPDITRTAAGGTASSPAAGTYVLFVNTAAGTNVTLTASAAGLAPASAAVNVINDGIVRQDFALGIANFTAAPTAFDLHVMVNNQVTTTLAVSNSGDEAGRYDVLTFDTAPPATLANPATAAVPLQLIHCQHISPLGPIAGGSDPGCSNGSAFTETSITRALSGYGSSSWQSIAAYPDAIMDNATATDDATGKVYSVAGYDGWGWRIESYVYDPNADTWTRIADPPALPFSATAAFFDGRLYVAFGWVDAIDYQCPPCGGTTNLYAYDPATDTWSVGASAPQAEGGGVAAVVLGNEIYFIGGCTNASSCGDTAVQVYDPAANSWSLAAPYPHPVDWASCGAVDGKLYCAGGIAGATAYADGYVYDPTTNAWAPIADLPVGAGGLWGSIYSGTPGGLAVSGGVTNDSTTITNQGYLYTPSDNSWSALPNALNAVYDGGSACGFYQIGGSIGVTSAPVPNAERLLDLDPCTTSSIPWLTFSPASGTLTVGATANLQLTFDGTGRTEGTTSQAYLLLRGAMPYGPVRVPLTVHWDPQPVDLAVAASGTPSTVTEGGSVTFTVTVTNLNETNHGPAAGTTLDAQISQALTNVTFTGPGTCTNSGSGDYVCNMGDLALGASDTETITGQAPLVAETLTSSFSVSAQETDSNASNNLATVQTVVQAANSGGGGSGSGGGGGGGALDPWLLVFLSMASMIGSTRRRFARRLR